MPIPFKIVEEFRVQPGSKVHLKEFDTSWSGKNFLGDLDKAQLKARSEALLLESRQRLAQAQALLSVQDNYAILAVFQAMDAGGKDGAIKHVFSGVNPEGCQVTSFKSPSAEELDHTYLWRCAKAVPERGKIGIFNRSHYEETLVARVHPAILANQKLPPRLYDLARKDNQAFWQERYADINDFERHLARNGTIVIKFFLHISKDEQKQRFLDRLQDPAKHWKFSLGDLDERAYWDAYMKAFDDTLEATSTAWAPWYIIPGDYKWSARALISQILTDAILNLNLDYPKLSPEREKELQDARNQLMAETTPGGLS